MLAKSLFAVLTLAAGMAAALPAPHAQADVNVEIIPAGGSYGDDGWYYEDGYHPPRYRDRPYRPRPPYYYDPPYYDDPPYHDEETQVYITCQVGKSILRERGFRNVKTENCKGPNYRYTAKKNGRKYDVRMDTSGEINRVRRVD